jgi:alkanesulfonate monooxygenase SsuD/methylene tetrahydromethanopterin reductase-like flavin-dependent oxidoreductase (luciferase family)
MTAFDPDRFEDKYEHYFTELQQAYRQAFEVMSERHDSELIHAIDQQILAESEPFYAGDGEFRIELPDAAADRLADWGQDRIESVLAEYKSELETQLQTVFEFEA